MRLAVQVVLGLGFAVAALLGGCGDERCRDSMVQLRGDDTWNRECSPGATSSIEIVDGRRYMVCHCSVADAGAQR